MPVWTCLSISLIGEGSEGVTDSAAFYAAASFVFSEFVGLFENYLHPQMCYFPHVKIFADVDFIL